MIKSLRLERFKNFRDATLQLGPLTVVVGTNASGKSNLRDGFRFLHGMSRGYSLAEIIGEKYVEGGILQWKGIRGGTREVALYGEKDFGLTTEAEIEAGSPLFPSIAKHFIQVGVGEPVTPPYVTRESFRWAWNTLFDSHDEYDPPEQEGHPYIFVRLTKAGYGNRKLGKRLRFLDNQSVLSQFRDRKEVNKSHRDSANAFLSSLESMRFLDLSPEAMKLPSVPGQTILGDRGENLSSVLYSICRDSQAKQAVTQWVRELTPLDVVDFDFVPDQTGRILLTLIEANGERTSAYSASDGTLRFLTLIAALMGPDTARFYFLEEIDNGIHPTRLFLLLQLIEQCAEERSIQIVTTTHSPQLLAMLSEKARKHVSLVYRAQGTTEARIVPVSQIPQAETLFQSQNLGRLLESGWLEDAVSFSREGVSQE